MSNLYLIKSKNVEIICDDLHLSVCFDEAAKGMAKMSTNYLVIQRCFEDYHEENEDSCYIECLDLKLNGHFDFLITKLYRDHFEIIFDDETIKIEFNISNEKFKKLKKVLRMILVCVSDIECLDE